MKQQQDLKVFEFGQAAILPNFEEKITNKPYILYGPKNDMPQRNIDMYNFSSVNRACIKAVVNGVVGKDLLINGEEGYTLVNSKETLYDLYKKVSTDFVIHGGFAVNTVKRRDGEGIASLYHMDFSKIRSGKVNEYDHVKEYYYSADWEKSNKYKPIEIPAFDMDAEGDSQVYYSFPYQPNQKYYPIPSYIAGAVPIQIDIEIMNFELNNIQNSYYPSLFISLNNGIPGVEEREEIYRNLEEKYSSSNNAGKMFLNFSENKENEPTIETISPNNSPDLFNSVNEIVQTKILQSHGITRPDLLSIKTSGSLGDRNDIILGYAHFLNTTVKPMQNYLIREFEKLLFFMTGEVKRISIVQNELMDAEENIEEAIDNTTKELVNNE